MPRTATPPRSRKSAKATAATELPIDPVRGGWKVFTSDLRPPVQGGEPVWSGSIPATLPTVTLDRSREECAAGWNYCSELASALRIAGLWPDGKPSRAFLVEAAPDALERGNKRRASSLRILREASETEIEAAIVQLSAPFGPFTNEMVAEQLAWRRALSRPNRDHSAVEKNLTSTLASRALPWTLKQFPNARAAWAARDAWAALDARDAWDAWDAWAAWDAWDAWDARAALDARDAWDAWAAWAALTWWYAAKREWVAGDPAKYTTGLRDAYTAGLAIALPTGPNELGWAFADDASAVKDADALESAR